MALPGTCFAVGIGVAGHVAKAILWIGLAVAIFVGFAFAVLEKGTPAADYALSKVANTACVSDILTALDFLTVCSKVTFVPQHGLA